MKRLLTAILFSAFAVSAFAEDTNTFSAPLFIDGAYYTNARISSANAAYVTLLYDGGGKKFLLSSLPEDLQKRFNYDPQAAQDFLSAEAAKKSASSAKLAELQAEELKAQNAVGEAQDITIVRVDGGTPVKCLASTTDGQQEILIRNLPASVGVALLKYDEAETQNQPSSPNPVPASNSGGKSKKNRAKKSAKQQPASTAVPSNQLSELKKEADRQSKIRAKPTGMVFGGCRIWIFDSFISTNSPASAPPAKT